MAVESADDGDNTEYCYVPSHSITGFFLFKNDWFCFYLLHPHANHCEGRTFLPINCTTILGSSMGIVLCYPYAVSNPLIENSGVEIPTLTTTHTYPIDPHALVAYPDDNLGLVFYIVCAFSIGHHEYKFNAYSSYTNEWQYGQMPENLGDIMADTSMSCGMRAYWLTKRPLPEVVYYDVSDVSHGFLDVPTKFQADPCPCQLQLGTSYTNEWQYGQMPENLGDIMADTSMSCGMRAYWLTKRPLPEVVYYDVSDVSHGFLDVPTKFQADPCPCQLQLGTWGRNQLILLASMATEMEVYTLTHGQQQWELSFRQEFPNRRPPIPIRSQSHILQAVFWVDDRMLIWEKRCNERSMGQPTQPPRMRLQPCPEMQPDVIVTSVPYIENNLRPHDFVPGHGFRHE